MRGKKRNQDFTRRISLIGLLTALTVVLSYIRIPVVSTVTVNLVLPIVVVGAILCGPFVGAWLTVIPAIISFPEAALFMTYNLPGTVLTLILKGLLAGFVAGVVYEALAKKHPKGAVFASAVLAPIVNTGTFLLGCYVFIWPELVELAAENGVGIGALLVGLAGINFVVEMIINIVLCPALVRVIELSKKKFPGFVKK